MDAAYLNASLKEDIYMCQPRGFEAPSEEDKVFHLKRAIYGLKQSGREWYKDLMGRLTTIGFKRCRVEHAVFYRFDQDATILLGAYMHHTLNTSLIYFNTYPIRSNFYQNIQNYSKIFFSIFLYFYSHLFECSSIFLSYV